MSTLQDQIRAHYRDRSLRPDTAARLEALALVETGVATAEMSKRSSATRPWKLGVIAASLLGLGFLAGLSVSHMTDPAVPGMLTSSADAASSDLVAVNIHADWCKRTPTVEPIFSELVDDYGNRSILFVTLDITTDQTRLQAQQLATNLGIPGVFDGPFESGMIKLIDRRRGELLALLTGKDQMPTMEGLLAQAVDLGLRPESNKR